MRNTLNSCTRCNGTGYETGIDDMGDIYFSCQKCKNILDEGDIDSDREMLRERDMERLQASAETGGDY